MPEEPELPVDVQTAMDAFDNPDLDKRSKLQAAKTFATARIAAILSSSSTSDNTTDVADEEDPLWPVLFQRYLAGEFGSSEHFPFTEFEQVLSTIMGEIVSSPNFSSRAVEKLVLEPLLEDLVLPHTDLLQNFLVFLSNCFRTPKLLSTLSGQQLFFDLLQKVGGYLLAQNILNESSTTAADQEQLFFPALRKTDFKLRKTYVRVWRDYLKAFNVSGAGTPSNNQTHNHRAQAEDLTKKLLLHLTNVFPYLDNSLALAQFYMQQFDQGSLEVQICALSGILYLSTQKNVQLEDDYYARLYTLLKPETMNLKYRLRFQRVFAASLVQATSLSGLLAACFAKRLAFVAGRLCSSGPPLNRWKGGTKGAGGALCSTLPTVDTTKNFSVPSLCWCIALCYNLVRRHPHACRPLIHREGGFGVNTTKDPFSLELSLAEAADTVLAKHRTCLWELEALERHYHPLVSRLVGFFRSPSIFKKVANDIDVNEFLDLSPADLLAKEMK